MSSLLPSSYLSYQITQNSTRIQCLSQTFFCVIWKCEKRRELFVESFVSFPSPIIMFFLRYWVSLLSRYFQCKQKHSNWNWQENCVCMFSSSSSRGKHIDSKFDTSELYSLMIFFPFISYVFFESICWCKLKFRQKIDKFFMFYLCFLSLSCDFTDHDWACIDQNCISQSL